MTNRAYLQLEAENKRIDAVGGALSVLHWDRAVMMPPGGADARADQMAALQLIVHEMLTAPARADLIAEARARAGALDDWQEANLREMERALVRARARPARLVEALARARAQTEMAWRSARAADDFARQFLQRFHRFAEGKPRRNNILGDQHALARRDGKSAAELQLAVHAFGKDRTAAQLARQLISRNNSADRRPGNHIDPAECLF